MKNFKQYQDNSLAYQQNFDPYSGLKQSKQETKQNMSDYMVEDIFAIPNPQVEQKQNSQMPIASPFEANLRFENDGISNTKHFEGMPKILSYEEFVAKQNWEKNQQSYKTQQTQQFHLEQQVPVKMSRRERKRLEKEQAAQIKKNKKTEKNLQRQRLLRKVMGFVALFAFIAAIVLGYAMLNSYVFIAKNIRIEGIQKYTDEDILTLCGIRRNQSLQAIDPELVVKRINRSKDLRLMKFNFIYPNGIYMLLHEKKAVSVVQSKGYIYYLDEFGDVVEQKSSKEDLGNFIEVSNCVMYDPGYGAKTQIKENWQKEAYVKVMNAVVSLQAQNMFVRITIPKNDGIYLTTKDNFVIHLGSAENATQKIANAFSVCDYVKNNHKSGGRIDVSMPGKPVFSNEDNRVHYETKYYLEPSPSTVYQTVDVKQGQNENPALEAYDNAEDLTFIQKISEP